MLALKPPLSNLSTWLQTSYATALESNGLVLCNKFLPKLSETEVERLLPILLGADTGFSLQLPLRAEVLSYQV